MTRRMPRARPENVIREKNRHGNYRWYYRLKGKKRVRLPDTFGTDEFYAACDAAKEGKPVTRRGPQSGTFAWLVSRYKESAHFRGLADSSRYSRDKIMQGVVAKAGHAPFARITKAKIIEGMNERADRPHAANNFLVAMSVLFTWAVKNDHVATNPCRDVDPMKVKTVGHHPWTIEEVEQFRKAHPIGTKPRLALDLMLFTGLRRSDVIIVGKQHVRENVITLRTRKSGAIVTVPIFPELRRSIDETKTGDLAFVTASDDKPFRTGQAFFSWFARQVKAAKLHGRCTPHGLRKAGATIAANHGATVHELMAMFGWSRSSMAEVYTKTADRARLARAAAERIANNSGRTHDEGAVSSGEKAAK